MKRYMFIFFGVFLLAIAPLTHKFYVTETQMEYSLEDNKFQIICRIFTDDLEKTLERNHHLQLDISKAKKGSKIEELIKKYFLSRFEIVIDEKIVKLHFLGTEYDRSGVTKCYVESERIRFKKKSQLTLKNVLLTDMFEEQQNITNIKINRDKNTIYTSINNTNRTIKPKI